MFRKSARDAGNPHEGSLSWAAGNMARYGGLAGSSTALLMAFVMSLFKALKRLFHPNLFRFEKGRSAHGRGIQYGSLPQVSS
jgi:hypothetical protein